MTLALKNALLGLSISASGTTDNIFIDNSDNIRLSPIGISGVNITSSLIGNNGSFNTLKVNNIGVSTSGHQHNISDVQNLENRLTALSGASPMNTAATNNLYLWSNFK